MPPGLASLRGTTNVTNAALAVLPSSLLADNPYLIRLVGRDQTQVATAFQEIIVSSGEYKPGPSRSPSTT